MFDKVEAFYRPASVREALRLLHDGDGRARVVAGGTDVAVQADESIRILIDITRAGLNYIHRKRTVCSIGATVTMAALETAPEIRELAGGILSHAAATSGSVQIRNVATVGGNLANGSPAADTATPLLALDAQIVLAPQTGGRKRVPLSEFYREERGSLLHETLLTEVAIPIPPNGACFSFQKLGRTELDLSLVNVAAGLQLDKHDRVKWIRIALGAVAPAPMRALGAEQLATGRTFDESLLRDVCAEVGQEVQPITDVRASAEYRRTVSQVLTRRALLECASQLGGSR